MLLRLGERAPELRLGAAQVAPHAEMLPQAEPGLDLAAGMATLAEQRAGASQLLVGRVEPAQLGEGDAQVEREVGFLVREAGPASLHLAATELPDGALDLAGAQEAETQQI